jgi:hypothetical protein
MKRALATVLLTAKIMDQDFDQQTRPLFLGPQLVAYELHILQTLAIDQGSVPFDLLIDHHLSWDECESWIAYFKDLHRRLPAREGRLLHAAMKRIIASENYTGCEERLLEMISGGGEGGDETWKNVKSALAMVLVTARGLDSDFLAVTSPGNIDLHLFPYALLLSERVVPDLHVPFELLIDHHLSWDKSGTWIAYFKDLYRRLPPWEGRLLHAAIKIITSSETPHLSKKRLASPPPSLRDRDAFQVSIVELESASPFPLITG